MAAAVKKNQLTKALLLLAILVTAAVAVAATPTTTNPDDDEDVARFPGRRRRRNRHGGRTPSPSPNRPTPTPAPATPVPAPRRTPPPPPPSPPGILLPCDRPDVPPMLAVNAQNGTSAGRRTDCIPTPTPPPPSPRTPPTPPQPHYRRPPLCICPKRPGFGVPAPGGGGAGGGGGGAAAAGEQCVAPLAPLMACGPFITGDAEGTPTPHSECCVGLSKFLNSSTAAMAAGVPDGGLRCLCPFILGDVNRVLPRPIDPVRLMYLPIACGVVLPPQTLFMCFTGHPSPKAVTNFSELWAKEETVHVHGG